MTIPRVKGAGWGVGEKLLKTLISLFDKQVNERACDKQAGQNEALASNVTFSGTNVHSGPLSMTGAASVDGGGSLTLSGTKRVGLAPRSILRIPPCAFRGGEYTKWAIQAGAILQSTSVVANQFAYCEIAVPNGATIAQIDLYISGPVGHSALPATLPLFALQEVTAATGSITTVGNFIDAPASVATYEAPHTISSGPISRTIDGTAKRCVIQFRGESGTGSLIGLQILGATVTFTTASSLDDGAS